MYEINDLRGSILARFAQYDYGPTKNMKKYGSEEPPIYDFSKITAPVAFYYADSDGLISVEVNEVKV